MVMVGKSPESGVEIGHTARIERLYRRLWEGFLSKKAWWGEGLTVLDDPEVAASPLIVRKARAVQKVLSEMPIQIQEDELVVGMINMGSMGLGGVFPQYATPDEEAAAAEKSLSIYSVYGHSVPDYGKVLALGFRGIRDEIAARLRALTESGELTEGQEAFLRATSICCDAVVTLARRYSALASELAEREPDEMRRAELRKIARICSRVPENPAASFQEALQGFWFTYASLHSTITTAPVGRIDYFTGPFLEKELESGTITLEEAQELVDCLWMKFNERVQLIPEHRERHVDRFFRNTGHDPKEGTSRVGEIEPIWDNHWLQNVILSGMDAEGRDSTNEVTYLCLESTGRFELTQPTVSVRLSPQCPERLLRKCSQVIQGGGGMPAIFNDRVIVPSLERFGFPSEEARTYSHDGCWEPLIPGKTDFRWGGVHGHKAMEFLFTGGRSRITGRQEGLDTGDPVSFETFEQFLEAYRAQLDHLTRAFVEKFARYWNARHMIAPEPLLSCLIDGCIERAQDMTEGGARYIFYATTYSGLTHSADAIAAVKKLVYQEKRVSMAQLAEAMAANFEGFEPLRQTMLTQSPKYGNDDDYVDGILRDLLQFFTERLNHHAGRYPRFLFPCGVGAIGGTYSSFGKVAGATPDGRLAMEAVSAGLTPSTGRDLCGPTAALRSYTKVDHGALPTGAPLDLGMDSGAVRGEAGLQRLMAFVRGFLDMGGGILTVTVTDVETLRKAQREPEKYRGLRVRMGGYQAYFVTLSPEHQEHHIARVKHSFR